MPWNDKANPGPWGSPGPDNDQRGGGGGQPPRGPRLGGPRGPRGPRGGGGGRDGGGGPDFNAYGEELNRRLRDFFSGPGGRGVRPGAVGAVAAVAFGLWAITGIYFVAADEQGVVTTLGRYSRTVGSGAHYHLPSPLERVEKVSVGNVRREDIGGADGSDVPAESLMITGDENIVDVDFTVAWRVSDPAKFLFTISDGQVAVKAVAESSMREVVGRTALETVMTRGRGQVQAQATELMQRTLDGWGAGVTVVEVQIRTASPPQEVNDAFRAVSAAQQEADALVNEANAYRNRVVNEAKGDAARIVQAGQAYREQAVREASGEAARFSQIYEQYRRAPGVTRERLYIETMQRVLERSNKVVVDGKGASAPIILPPDVFRPRAARQAAPPPPTETPPQPAAPQAQERAQ